MCADDCLRYGGVVGFALWGALPPVFGGVVWGVYRGFFGVWGVFLFALVWCLVLYSYWMATVLLYAVWALGGLGVRVRMLEW